MSYDLFFLRRPGEKPLTYSELEEYFLSRPNYKANESQFWYENEDTGVYFSFEYGDPSDAGLYLEDETEQLPDDDWVDAGLSFNLNYYRPHTFGLEAELELSDLVGTFRLLVDDPQNEGMGRGEYSRDGFLQSWNTGNAFGHHAYMSREAEGDVPLAPGSGFQLPASELERLWTWNFNYKSLQERLEVDAYVAPIRLIKLEDRPVSFAVWVDGIPEAFPKVDFLFLVRDKLGPRSFFKEKKDMCLVPFQTITPLLSLARERTVPVHHYLFDHVDPPRKIVELFKSQKSLDGQLDGLAWDQVLTAEIVEEVRSKMNRR